MKMTNLTFDILCVVTELKKLKHISNSEVKIWKQMWRLGAGVQPPELQHFSMHLSWQSNFQSSIVRKDLKCSLFERKAQNSENIK